MKNSFMIFIFCFFLITSMAWCAQEIPGFDEVWVNPETNFSSYDAIFIDRLDLSAVNIDVFDPYPTDDHSNDNKTDNDIRNEMAMQIHELFSDALGKVMPVEEKKSALGNKKALILKVRLSGTVEDESLLRGELFKLKGTSIHIDCELDDYNTSVRMLTVSDDYEKTTDKSDISTLRGSDLDRWYKAADFWAKGLADYIASKRR